MTKNQIYMLRLRLRTIREKLAHGIFRLALRFPQKCKIFGGPLLAAIVTCAAIALGLSSCNVTRTITTQSQYYQRGDTTCTIVTKTIEQYDASKKGF
jgi:hypothetical protein